MENSPNRPEAYRFTLYADSAKLEALAKLMLYLADHSPSTDESQDLECDSAGYGALAAEAAETGLAYPVELNPTWIGSNAAFYLYDYELLNQQRGRATEHPVYQLHNQAMEHGFDPMMPTDTDREALRDICLEMNVSTDVFDWLRRAR